MLLLLYFIDLAFTCYFWMVMIYILSSWFPESRENKLIRFIQYYVEPYLEAFRGIIPPIGGVLDISPLIAIFVLQILEHFVKRFFIVLL